MPPQATSQWLAQKEEENNILFVYHLRKIDPLEVNLYKNKTERAIEAPRQ